MSTNIDCVLCDCCNCSACVSDTDNDVDISVYPTDICKNRLCNLGDKQSISAFTRDVNPCIDNFRSAPGSCAASKHGGKITYWVRNNTDHCIAVFLFLDITNLTGTKCHVEAKAPHESVWYSFPAGNRTDELFGLIIVTPQATVSLTFCFRLRGCADPCCFQKAILTNLKWQPRCIDKGQEDGGYCSDWPSIICPTQCCDCCCQYIYSHDVACCADSWFDVYFENCGDTSPCEYFGAGYDCVRHEDLPPLIISYECSNPWGIDYALCPSYEVQYCDYYLTNPDDPLCQCWNEGSEEEPYWRCLPAFTVLHYEARSWEFCDSHGTAHCGLTSW